MKKVRCRFAGAALFEICLLFRGYRFSASRTKRRAYADNGADLASDFAPWGFIPFSVPLRGLSLLRGRTG